MWFTIMQAKKAIILDAILLEKAKDFTVFTIVRVTIERCSPNQSTNLFISLFCITVLGNACFISSLCIFLINSVCLLLLLYYAIAICEVCYCLLDII